MKNCHVRKMIVLNVLYLGAVASFAQDGAKAPEGAAQPVPTLPTSFKGKLNGSTVSLQQVSTNVELQIASQNAEGKVTGGYSRAVRYSSSPETLCIKADNLPAEGTYDGKKLVLKVKGSQNAAICKDYTLAFLRGTEHYFELKAADGSWSIYLDPVK
jgi:hypothetical protein